MTLYQDRIGNEHAIDEVSAIVRKERIRQLDHGYDIRHDAMADPHKLTELVMDRLQAVQNRECATSAEVLDKTIEAAALLEAIILQQIRHYPLGTLLERDMRKNPLP